MAVTPYNPLQKANLGKSVAEAMLARSAAPLADLKRFEGAGVYAIYYTGQFAPYRQLAKHNQNGEFERPIYVGKAVPAGARKGGFGLDAEPGTVLYHRLREHSESISCCEELNKKEFFCRYLITDDIWIPLAEAILIDLFDPVWNRVLDGFGNHDPGKGRRKQQRSPWDTLHPGRNWAKKLAANAKTPDQFRKLVEDFLKGKPVPTVSTQEAVTKEE